MAGVFKIRFGNRDVVRPVRHDDSEGLGWLLFLPLFLFIVYEGARTYSYSLTVDGDRISVAGFWPAQYAVSKITAINVWFAKGGRIAVVTFSDRGKLRLSSRLTDFEGLVALLRNKANLAEQSPEQ